MEKNGNTFVPGDRVVSTSVAKTAGAKLNGTVHPDTADGRVKVGWDDGTVTWERPDDLNPGR